MLVFQIVLGLLVGGAVLWNVAQRLGVPPPALLALVGAGLALVPGVPDVRLDPGLALALFVSPVLLDAAYDTSLRDLADNWKPVTTLVLAVVALTTAVVAVVARLLVPDLPWAAAVALGAVVSPPDASAATSVLRQLSPPHRVMVVLEGESLLNDASALLIFRLALVAQAGTMSPHLAVPYYAVTTLAGVALGVVLAWGYMRLPIQRSDIGIYVLLQFLGTFAVWLIAEALDVSAILALVGYAATIARIAPLRTPGRERIASYAVWEVAITVLTMLAFILAGLQLKGILARIDGRTSAYLLFAGAICLAVMATRFFWVMGWNIILRWKNKRYGAHVARDGMATPTWQTGIVIGWCGMRGIVTLATALALPNDFPHRDLLVFAAYSVVLVTLVLQGSTVGPMLRWLRLEGDGAVQREVALARAETARAALRSIGENPATPAAAALRADYEDRLRRAESQAAVNDQEPELAAIRQRLVRIERGVLTDLRAQDRIGDHAFHVVEEDLDWSEADAGQRLRSR